MSAADTDALADAIATLRADLALARRFAQRALNHAQLERVSVDQY